MVYLARCPFQTRKHPEAGQTGVLLYQQTVSNKGAQATFVLSEHLQLAFDCSQAGVDLCLRGYSILFFQKGKPASP